jgi:Co/Zn/Cd efflux system component
MMPWKTPRAAATRRTGRMAGMMTDRETDKKTASTGDAAALPLGTPTTRLRSVVRLVAILNLAYFGVEFAVAVAIGSVSLFADSIDFLEDASINFLIFAALGWTALRRARLGMMLAAILLIPGVATLWMAWRKFATQVPPAPLSLSLAGGGAFVVNLACAIMLAQYRRHRGSLTRAAFLSARNDVLANVAIVGAGVITAYTRSAWPDLIVGLGIALMNADAAKEVYTAARAEHREAEP